jgi:hypothetical protein
MAKRRVHSLPLSSLLLSFASPDAKDGESDEQ